MSSMAGSHKASRGGPYILVTDTCHQNHEPGVTPLQGTQSAWTPWHCRSRDGRPLAALMKLDCPDSNGAPRASPQASRAGRQPRSVCAVVAPGSSGRRRGSGAPYRLRHQSGVVELTITATPRLLADMRNASRVSGPRLILGERESMSLIPMRSGYTSSGQTGEVDR